MAIPTTIKSTDQAIGAFGTNTDALSLVRNMVEGAVNKDMTKVGQAATDAIKLGIYYADLLGKGSGNVGLVNSAASLALKLDNLNTKLKTGQATNYADWAEVVAEAGRADTLYGSTGNDIIYASVGNSANDEINQLYRFVA